MSKVTVKYQVTIPPRIRAALNIMPGIKVDFQEEKLYLLGLKEKPKIIHR